MPHTLIPQEPVDAIRNLAARGDVKAVLALEAALVEQTDNRPIRDEKTVGDND